MLPFLTLDNIKVVYSAKEAINGLSLQVNEGEQWAITGGSGSGKTTLLETIAGKHLVREGEIHHHYYHRFLQSHTVDDPYFNYKRLIAEVSHQHHFKNRYNLSEFYYQQRFNSADADEAISVKDYLRDLSSEAHLNAQVIGDLHLEELLDRSLIKLSNGETRRLMFAAALIKRPELLLLDAPFTGLDTATRPYFHELINRLIASGITIVMATSENEIPEGITHVARLDKGKVAGVWKKPEFVAAQGEGAVKELRSETAGPDRELLERLLADRRPRTFEYAVRMRQVSVTYGDTPILQGIDWEVKRGECWALSGHNGAGKSALLSLINADNPQAYANDLFLFDKKRGSGESIWDIKKKTGYVSPELHQYFKTQDTCLQVVLSGLFDTLGLIRKCSPEQEARAASWLKALGIAGQAGQPFRRSSLSTQRLTLIARALVKNPPLLILDEPCQGMDAEQVQRIRLLIDAVCRISGTTLIYVSHYTDEIPSCVNKLLKLEHGKLAYSGKFPASS
ncbi:molybdate transport system ATP-binding protein [Anseongella ginsenosidimutans]|uniref:Molybdate transport system ATP-binding protein n=1 Tax=Anseongella ginsenosidimutans TaxID=496056 RepID=A0A4V2UTU8_9SPHI|nr:ATP-binding cassette domain-containing protein [Anseongella ginsenosidimutans]QEC53136.1 ATP-binding cassette domain-containing protein [Anseongella ginsenosidimutans]TCS87758.1 molybdate transport system ATP-binding protein [Anseongella ginsenosidimutans]